jgi:uncharacterized protein
MLNDATQTLEPFDGQWAVLLTTYMGDGTPVGTAVNIAVEGDLAYFRTWDTAWKLRRIRNNPRVQFAPSTARGKPTAPPIWARARVLEGEDSAHAGRLLTSKYPALHGLLVPLVHRLRGNKTMHVELTPAEAPSQTTWAPFGSPTEPDDLAVEHLELDDVFDEIRILLEPAEPLKERCL